jgi:hypothetical protein
MHVYKGSFVVCLRTRRAGPGWDRDVDCSEEETP